MFIEIGTLFLFVVGSMFFSGAETAMFSVSPLNLVRGNKKKLYWLYLRKDKIVTTCLIGNSITIVGATIIIDHLVLTPGQIWTTLVTLGIEAIVIFLLAEVFPKTITQRLGLKTLEILYYPIIVFYYLFFPFSKVFSLFTDYLSKVLSLSTPFKREDIFAFLAAQMSGQDITKSLMGLNTTTAKEIMTPLSKIYSLSKDASIGEVVKLLSRAPFSHYPVYEDRSDQITGYIHVSNILKAYKNDKIISFVENAEYVPESCLVDRLLFKMQEEKLPILFVVSELGSVVGLVTLEDIAEEFVGHIHNEDQPSLEMIAPREKEKNIFILSGALDIDDFNAHFRLNIKKSGFETLSGFLMKESMDIPKVNQIFGFDFGSLKVIDGSRRSIKKLKFKRK